MLAHNARSKQQVNKDFHLTLKKSEGGNHIYANIFPVAVVYPPYINATFPGVKLNTGK
jgi:hypothetical protein